MKTIENITSEEIHEYIVKHHKRDCSFCGSELIPNMFSHPGNDINIIYTDLKALDAYGNINPLTPSTPILPLACPICGNLSYIMMDYVLSYFDSDTQHDEK
ncbi:hypothetical protein KW448_08265 [Vibrio fluvialis]|nr:hypothetical protein [Vibrio fluvialis]